MEKGRVKNLGQFVCEFREGTSRAFRADPVLPSQSPCSSRRWESRSLSRSRLSRMMRARSRSPFRTCNSEFGPQTFATLTRMEVH